MWRSMRIFDGCGVDTIEMFRNCSMDQLTVAASSTEITSASIRIARGDRGDAVQQIQRLLIQKGYLSGGADGVFGSGTEAAVQAFQRDHG